ncbi:MAG: methionine ABC transporter substrate-binding protein [Burkholderiales bacterium]|nr:methionine ABC transporter substrate-binding protein [Burkholderiales bacterium]MBP9769666.1 methionine ABC transporter substrate-binding protein [Burkholderiales bacterium]
MERKRMSKKLLILILVGFSTAVFANETITIGASPVPQSEMLKFIKPLLAKQGYNLKIVEFSDYVTPNLALSQKQLDANFFQHQPYLAQYNHDHATNLVALTEVFIAPMGIYANKQSEKSFIQTKKISQIIKGSKIGVPNDPTNEGRALIILQANGLIKLKANVAYPTKKDILANPYQVQIKELDPAMLPRFLASGQLDLALINSNYALAANLNPSRDAVLLESKNSPFTNIVAVRPDELKQAKMQALAKVLTSVEMAGFIQKTYHGDIIPAF